MRPFPAAYLLMFALAIPGWFISGSAQRLVHGFPSEIDSAKFIVDAQGAIIRGDRSSKKIALVFTGDTFAEGGRIIRTTLRNHKVRASFFLTGNFYANQAFQKLIQDLKKDGHYLGAHSDKHLLYADWTKRDSLFVTAEEFRKDLMSNYARMAAYGIKSGDAPYFLPPYEWYNAQIVSWTKQLGLQLVNYSPGTKSAADYTFPEMGDRYLSSAEIYRSILEREETDAHGLNGFILLIHIGTDPRRTDKFYSKLDNLITALKGRNYEFLTITQLLK